MKIDKTIAPPAEYGHKTHVAVNALADMQYNDSCLFTYKEMRTTKAASIRSAIKYAASLLNIHVITKKQNTGVRAWKVK